VTKLQLPFWIVTEQKHILNPPANIPCEDPLAPHAFTSTEKLTAFMAKRAGGRWDVNLVADEEGLIVTIADLHQQGASRISRNPTAPAASWSASPTC
jgi:hypothetical protein